MRTSAVALVSRVIRWAYTESATAVEECRSVFDTGVARPDPGLDEQGRCGRGAGLSNAVVPDVCPNTADAQPTDAVCRGPNIRGGVDCAALSRRYGDARWIVKRSTL